MAILLVALFVNNSRLIPSFLAIFYEKHAHKEKPHVSQWFQKIFCIEEQNLKNREVFQRPGSVVCVVILIRMQESQRLGTCLQ